MSANVLERAWDVYKYMHRSSILATYSLLDYSFVVFPLKWLFR